jgi:hypothetical protein
LQSKQVAVAGILTGGVVTGLGVVVLLAGLAEADRPERAPVIGYEDVGNAYPDVDPLPPPPSSSNPSKGPAGRSSAGPGGAIGDRDGETVGPNRPGPTETGSSGVPTTPREPDRATETGDSAPSSGPTRTAEPEPSTSPTESSDVTPEPTPSETATPTTEP